MLLLSRLCLVKLVHYVRECPYLRFFFGSSLSGTEFSSCRYNVKIVPSSCPHCHTVTWDSGLREVRSTCRSIRRSSHVGFLGPSVRPFDSRRMGIGTSFGERETPRVQGEVIIGSQFVLAPNESSYGKTRDGRVKCTVPCPTEGSSGSTSSSSYSNP